MPLEPTLINWDYLKPLIPIKNYSETKELNQNSRNSKFLIAFGFAALIFGGTYFIINYNRKDED